MSIEDNCLLWNIRVVIPDVLRKFVLKELHDTHPRITHMRMLASSYVWWPNIDNAIENTVSTCDICQSIRNEPAKSQTHQWTYPSHAWSRIHVDFAHSCLFLTKCISLLLMLIANTQKSLKCLVPLLKQQLMFYVVYFQDLGILKL